MKDGVIIINNSRENYRRTLEDILRLLRAVKP